MALVTLPIGEKPNYHIDSVSKRTSVSDSCYNGYIDESKTVRRRGCLKPWINTDTGKPGDGLFRWHQLDRLVAVSGGRVWLIDKTGAKTELTGVTLNETSITFADGNELDGSPWLYLADGGYPVYTTGGAMTRLTSASGAPSACSHIGWNTGRFLVKEDNSRKFYASDTDPATGMMDNTYFLASENPLTAESRPDTIAYLGVMWEEIVIWGSQGVEFWRPDSTFFSELSGTFTPVGLIAPRSVQEINNTVYALCHVDGDHKRAVVRFDERTPKVVSLPIEKILQNYDTVDDAIGFITNNSEYVITFPSVGETWCHDYRNEVWYPWTRWNQDFAQHEDFLGRHSATAWGKTFIQSRVDGQIYQYDRDTYQDDGGIVATEYVTGWLNHGTGNLKRSNRLRITVKRAQGAESGTEPIMIIRWRDDGSQEWKNERQISLGKQGQYQFYRELWGLGMYRSRQYSFRITDNADLALVSVEEDVDGMAR